MKAFIICLLFVNILLAACAGSMNGASGEPAVTVGNPTDIHTSSDMNISPPNLTTSDPAIKRQDTLTSPKTP